MGRVPKSVPECKDSEGSLQWTEPCVDWTEQRVSRGLGLLGRGLDDDRRCAQWRGNEHILQLNHGGSALQSVNASECAIGVQVT